MNSVTAVATSRIITTLAMEMRPVELHAAADELEQLGGDEVDQRFFRRIAETLRTTAAEKEADE
jgi:hypothetical protein